MSVELALSTLCNVTAEIKNGETVSMPDVRVCVYVCVTATKASAKIVTPAAQYCLIFLTLLQHYNLCFVRKGKRLIGHVRR